MAWYRTIAVSPRVVFSVVARVSHLFRLGGRVYTTVQSSPVSVQRPTGVSEDDQLASNAVHAHSPRPFRVSRTLVLLCSLPHACLQAIKCSVWKRSSMETDRNASDCRIGSHFPGSGERMRRVGDFAAKRSRWTTLGQARRHDRGSAALTLKMTVSTCLLLPGRGMG